MELFEYQAKSLLQQAGLHVAPYYLIERGEDIGKKVARFSFDPAVLKVQSLERKEPPHTAQGISTIAAQVTSLFAIHVCDKILVMPVMEDLVCYTVKLCINAGRVFVELSSASLPHLMVEEVTEEKHLFSFQLNRMVAPCKTHASRVRACLISLIDAFFKLDGVSFEITLALAESGILQVTDATMFIDDDALYRQPEIAHFKNVVLPRENITFHRLDGTILCMANGAALGWAMIDALAERGKMASGLLDIGSEVTEEQVVSGLRWIQKNTATRTVLIHLFTGLYDGETIARAIEKELQLLKIRVVILIEGTNSGGAVRFLRKHASRCIVATTVKEAVASAL